MVNINNFLSSIWKNCHYTNKQLLVSDVVLEYREISVFSHRASVFMTDKNPFAPVLFAQSVTLSVLSVPTDLSALRFLATGDVGTSPSAVHALCSDSPLLTTVSASDRVNCLKFKLRQTGLLCCSFPCKHFASVQNELKKTEQQLTK